MPTYILAIDDLFRVEAPTEENAKRLLLEKLGEEPYIAYTAEVVDVENDGGDTEEAA
jgi:hypothetical protein